MRTLVLVFLSCCFSVILYAQNVGIGTEYPNNAKLIVRQPGPKSLVVFGDSLSGLSFVENNAATIGFNNYFDGGRKLMSNGWASYLFFNSSVGTLFYNTTDLSSTQGSILSYTNKVAITSAGNVGIGNGSPSFSKLDVVSSATENTILARTSTSGPGMAMFNAGLSPTFGYNIAMDGTYSYVGNGFGGMFQYTPSTGDLNYYSSSASGTGGNPVGSFTTSFFTLDAAGRVGLSTSAPSAKLHVNGNAVVGSGATTPATGYSLSVDGKIICEEARVQNSLSWPDYVFKENYTLRPIEELEKLIRSQGHLPNIPPASQVEKEGFDLGDMNKKLLEKIEELTLYIIALNKENKALNERVKKLEEK